MSSWEVSTSEAVGFVHATRMAAPANTRRISFCISQVCHRFELRQSFASCQDLATLRPALLTLLEIRRKVRVPAICFQQQDTPQTNNRSLR